MSKHKPTREQAKVMEEARTGMAQLGESVAAEVPWLSADEVNAVVDQKLVTAARELDEMEAQPWDALSAQPSAWVRSASP
jgi:hypothetical protein